MIESVGNCIVRCINSMKRLHLRAIACLVIFVMAIDSPISRANQYVVNTSLKPINKKIVQLKSLKDLEKHLTGPSSNTTYVIAPGTYRLTKMLVIRGVKNIEIRGGGRSRNSVKIFGKGYTNKNYGEVRHCIEFMNTSNARVSNLTIGDVYYHPITIQGDCADMHFRNVYFVDAGQQFLKGNYNNTSGRGIVKGLVEYCLFEYTKQARSDYTQGIDIHAGKDWIIRNNVFNNIVSPASYPIAGHAIIMWNGSENTICENNLVMNCNRGIAFGLNTGKPPAKGKVYDHVGGKIKNNLVIRDARTRGHDGILLTNSPKTVITQNVVLMSGYKSPIEYRSAKTTQAMITNNIIDGKVWRREGAKGTEAGNKIVSTQGAQFKKYRTKAQKYLEQARSAVKGHDAYVFHKLIAKQIYRKKYLGSMCNKLNKSIQTGSAEKIEEAESLLALIHEQHAMDLSLVKDTLRTDPIEALDMLTSLKRRYQGSPLVDVFDKHTSDIKGNPNYKHFRAAARLYNRAEERFERLAQGDLASKTFRKRHSSTIKSVLRSLDTITKKHANTPYAQQAMTLIEKLK